MGEDMFMWMGEDIVRAWVMTFLCGMGEAILRGSHRSTIDVNIAASIRYGSRSHANNYETRNTLN